MLRRLFTFLRYFLSKDKQYYFRLVYFLGFLPGNVLLYRTAFTHKSASLQLKDGTIVNNERLEYLGDALLGAVVAEFVYHHFDHMDEGYMTKLRSRIVKRKHLNTIAIKMGVPEFVTSHPHSATNSKHLYGNALEALIGAIYLDQGFRSAVRFFRNRMIRKHIDISVLAQKDSDYKSQLIEWAQKNRVEVVFRTHEGYDPESKVPSFESVVSVNSEDFGHGIAESKKESEQRAAKMALNSMSA
jgi:ribonuclease III